MLPARSCTCLPLGAPPAPSCACCAVPALSADFEQWTICDAEVTDGLISVVPSTPPSVSLRGGQVDYGVDPIFAPGVSLTCDAALFEPGTKGDPGFPYLFDATGNATEMVAFMFEVPTPGQWSVVIPSNADASQLWFVGGSETEWGVSNGDYSESTGYLGYTADWFNRPHVGVVAHNSSTQDAWVWLDGAIYAAGVLWPSAAGGSTVFGNVGLVDVYLWWAAASFSSFFDNESPEQLALFAAIEAQWSSCITFDPTPAPPPD